MLREPINDPRIDPKLATDLAKPTDEQLATDLSQEAVKARDRARRMEKAAKWARKMKRAFKGITGAPSKPGYVKLAILRDPVLKEEYEHEGE